MLDINTVIYGVIYLFYEPNPNDPLNHGECSWRDAAREDCGGCPAGLLTDPPRCCPAHVQKLPRCSAITKLHLIGTCKRRCGVAEWERRLSPSYFELVDYDANAAVGVIPRTACCFSIERARTYTSYCSLNRFKAVAGGVADVALMVTTLHQVVSLIMFKLWQRQLQVYRYRGRRSMMPAADRIRQAVHAHVSRLLG